MLYEANFTGRKNGSIGILFRFRRYIQAKTREQALERLYETHEHITAVTLREVSSNEGAMPEGAL